MKLILSDIASIRQFVSASILFDVNYILLDVTTGNFEVVMQ
jgi:hypothetical protein